MIKLKNLIKESDENYRNDWLERHDAKFTSDGRLIAYHGTTLKNSELIKKFGIKNIYYTTDDGYAYEKINY